MTGLVEVELEDEGPQAGSGEPRRASPHRQSSARAWSRVALVTATVLAAGAVLDGAAAASLARPGAGLVADLRAQRSVLWRADAARLLGIVGDAVVLDLPEGGGVVARGVADGAVRWSLPAQDCRLVDMADEAGRPSDAVVARRDARLVCEWMPSTQTTTVTIADAADGTVLTSFADGADSPGLGVAGRYLVVATTVATGSRAVSVYSLDTGEHLWGAPADPGWSGGWSVAGGALVLLDPPRARRLATGEAVPVPGQEPLVRTVPLPDGASARLTLVPGEGGASSPLVEVLGADGAVRWSTAGWLASPGVGGGATVLPTVLRNGPVEVRDLADGTVLWTNDRFDPEGEAAGVLVGVEAIRAADGVTPSVEPGALVGFDARTGRELWRVPAVGAGRVLTDGRRLLVPAPDGLAVLALRTGEVVARWRVGTPADGAAALWPLPGGRFAWLDGTDVVVLGW